MIFMPFFLWSAEEGVQLVNGLVWHYGGRVDVTMPHVDVGVDGAGGCAVAADVAQLLVKEEGIGHHHFSRGSKTYEKKISKIFNIFFRYWSSFYIPYTTIMIELKSNNPS